MLKAIIIILIIGYILSLFDCSGPRGLYYEEMVDNGTCDAGDEKYCLNCFFYNIAEGKCDRSDKPVDFPWESVCGRFKKG